MIETTVLNFLSGKLRVPVLAEVPRSPPGSFAVVEKTDAGVILLAKTGTAEQIADKLQDFGVLVLAKPFTGAQFRQAVQIAASSYKRLAVLRTENAKLLDKIAQLRLVDRAKCYLIEKKGYTETDAHRLIEKRAMDTRMSRGEVAQEILDEEDEE